MIASLILAAAAVAAPSASPDVILLDDGCRLIRRVPPPARAKKKRKPRAAVAPAPAASAIQQTRIRRRPLFHADIPPEYDRLCDEAPPPVLFGLPLAPIGPPPDEPVIAEPPAEPQIVVPPPPELLPPMTIEPLPPTFEGGCDCGPPGDIFVPIGGGGEGPIIFVPVPVPVPVIIPAPAPPIPEPGIVAMLAAGLLALGRRARMVTDGRRRLRHNRRA